MAHEKDKAKDPKARVKMVGPSGKIVVTEQFVSSYERRGYRRAPAVAQKTATLPKTTPRSATTPRVLDAQEG